MTALRCGIGTTFPRLWQANKHNAVPLQRHPLLTAHCPSVSKGRLLSDHPQALPALNDDDIAQLGDLLAALPDPLQPPDLSSLDGYLCGVLLQPRPVVMGAWLPWVHDVEGQAAPAGLDLALLHALVKRRHAELERAITRRQWFDPWLFPEDEDEEPAAVLRPWVAGFAAAMDAFPALDALDGPALREPLALLYLHFDADELEIDDALRAEIDTIEPPPDLDEAVQDLVRAVMLIADISRPLTERRPRRPGPPARARRPR